MTSALRSNRAGVSVPVLGAALFIAILILAGCSSGPNITVALSSGATQARDQRKTLTIKATVAGDSNHEGVTWVLTSVTSWSYPPVFCMSGTNTGVRMGTTNPDVLRGGLEPQRPTSLTAGTYYVGTQEAVNQNVNETRTGEATITSGGSVTGTADATSLSAPEQGAEAISLTLNVNTDGTFSTSQHPGTISGMVISGSRLITVDGRSSAYPTIQVINGASSDNAL